MKILLSHLLLSLFAICTFAFPADPPNIVFIMADDLGYGELGCYGQEKIKTPNIDRLSTQGMRFTQHYTGAPVCAPARCVLMTGQHLGHAEVRNNKPAKNKRRFPGQHPISADVVTIAQVLQQAGYATGAFGKWGLGNSDSTGAPNRKGFDRFYGYISQRNAHSFYPPYLDDNDKEVTINEKPIPGHRRQPDGEVKADAYRAENYAPDLVLKEALTWLDAQKDNPFFLYLPFIEPHVAMQPPQEWIDHYPKAWDEEHGAYRGQNSYLPHPRPRAAYAAMISDLDEHVGAVLDRLEKHGLTDNTLVVFTSDNGPTHKASDPRWHVGGAACTFFNSAGGLRGYKGSAYEGGIRMPCIVRWPGQVKAGSTTTVPSYFPDWFVTLTAVGNGKLPADQVLDGVNLLPVLQGKAAPTREKPMIWEFHGYGGIVAVRDGKWKALRRDLARKKGKPADWELYDLSVDPDESTDLAAAFPERVKQLETAWLTDRSASPVFRLPIADGHRQ